MNRILPALWLANAIVALAVSLAIGPQPTGDTTRYLTLAHSLREGLGFTIEEAGTREPEGFRMPGYPAWLAAAETIAPGHAAAVTVAFQQLAVLLALALAARAVQITFGSRHAAIFLVLSALYPFMPAAACLLSPEALMAPLVSGAWLLLCRPTPVRGALAGVLIGCAVYLRPNAIVLAPIAALALGGKGFAPLKSAAAVILGCSVLLAPWAVRNGIVFGRPSPLPPVGAYGRVLLMGTWEARIPGHSFTKYIATGQVDDPAINAWLGDQIRRANEAIGMPANTVVILESYGGNRLRAHANQVLREQALRNIAERPFEYLARVAVRSVRMWFSMALPWQASTWTLGVLQALVLWGALVAVMGIVGAMQALWLRRSSTGARTGLLFLAGFVMTLCWVQTEARYTIPARHILLAFASIPILALLDRLPLRRRATR